MGRSFYRFQKNKKEPDTIGSRPTACRTHEKSQRQLKALKTKILLKGKNGRELKFTSQNDLNCQMKQRVPREGHVNEPFLGHPFKRYGSD